MAQPDVAYFGQKDAQQVVVIRRLVADLNLPVGSRRCRPCARPTAWRCRAATRCSRRPSASGRSRCAPRSSAAERLAAEGERSAGALLAAGEQMLDASGVDAEYLALVDPDTLEPVERLDGPALLALAARVGEVRLIDNATLQPVAGEAHAGKAVQPCSA